MRPWPADALAHSAAGPIIRQMNYLDVGKTPAQCHYDDQNHGDHAEITERLSSRRLLSRFGDHLEFALKIAFVPSPLCSRRCAASEQN
jgi:hypothetical protein